MTIRSDILALPELQAGARLTGLAIANLLERPKRDVSSTLGNMVRDCTLDSHKQPDTRAVLYSIPLVAAPMPPSRVLMLDAIWLPTQIPREVRHDAHY